MKYDVSGSNLWNPCMHLCNYSINKHHSDYVASDNLEADDRGHKWSISAFLKHLRANGLNTTALMQSIEVENLILTFSKKNTACNFTFECNNCNIRGGNSVADNLTFIHCWPDVSTQN